MSCFVTVAILLSAAAATPDYVLEWKNFKDTYAKVFDEEEESRRFEIFKRNVDIVNDYNSQNLTFQLGVNEFAHLDPDEFGRHYLGLKRPEDMWGDLAHIGTHVYSGQALPTFVDWTTKGAVTPVKNQGQCGSCWAFSTTGALEGAWEIKTSKNVSLSEQQFVDCDSVDHGCGGGLMDNGFNYARANALCTEGSYKYHAMKGTCDTSKCEVGIPKGGVTGYKDVQKDNKEAMEEAVAQQPVSIAIEADKAIFQMYKSGVISDAVKCGTHLDHGVLAVGYGTLNGVDYWKVKNSWGPRWGLNGYVLLKRGVPQAGECGILSFPSYPVVSTAAETEINI